MTTLGKYELLEKLGEGATSEVYRAHDTALGREVALKVLKPSLVADASAFERFSHEAHNAAGFFQTNIATVLDTGEADGRYFIAMRYIPGQSLDKVLKQGSPLPWKETLRLAQQIASALDFAHEQGFLHRDVKPSNIIRSPKGDFFLTDFGLTHAMMSTALTTHTGAVLGTPAYIAPEIWKNNPAVAATDQYALACVLCEALSGQTLFNGDTPPAVMTQHVLSGPKFPNIWPQDAPAGIEMVLRRALAANPDERYPNVAAFSAACAELVASKPAATAAPQPAEPRLEKTSLPSATAPHPTPKIETKSKMPAWAWVMLGLIAICLVVGAASGGLGWLVSRFATIPESIPAASAPALSNTLPESKPPATPEPTLTFAPTNTFTPGPAPTAGLGIGSTMLSDKDGMELVFVPVGEFEMGSNNDKADEKPVHTVYLDDFWIDKTEVTNAMYTLCVQAGKCDLPQNIKNYLDSHYADHPVGYVSWDDAQNYCAWAGRRLPSEAEWEKAARGADGRAYPWGNQSRNPDLLNYYYSNQGGTTLVGKYPKGASPYGAVDMAGNVWEWVADWYGSVYYKSSPSSNPLGPSSGEDRVLRGGSWYNIDASVRSANRLNLAPDSTLDSNGFRCALSSH